METNELLTSLARLESTLQEVESAKNQVKQTVEAYVILQEQIKEYTLSLDSIRFSIQGILSDIRARGSELGSEATSILASFEASARELLVSLNESTSNVLEELKTNLSKANEEFTNKSKDIATEFKNSTDEQLAKLQQSVLALQECTTSLEALQTSIKDTLSQIAQMRQEIADLKQALMDSQSSQDTILNNLQDSINTQSQKNELAFAEISNSLESIKESSVTLTNSVKDLIDTVIRRHDLSLTKIESLFQSNLERIELYGTSIMKESHFLRTFSIFAIVLIIGLAFLLLKK